MKIQLIKDKAFDQNSFLIIKNKSCLIVDPGYQEKDIDNFIQENSLEPKGILLTHYHFDHVNGVNSLSDKYGIESWINEKDYSYLIKDTMATWAGFAPVVIDKKFIKTFNSNFKLDEFDINILEAPGHSEGSTIFIFENIAFTGDVIFNNSFGRIDLPGGNANQMNVTLKCLKEKLSSVEILYPGHGPNIINK